MGKICPKCGYERKEADFAQDYECPMCGIIYDKFKNQNEDIIENEKITEVTIKKTLKRAKKAKAGFFDFLLAGPRMEEIKMALVGKYLFENKLNENQKKMVVEFADFRLKEGYAAQGLEETHSIEEFAPKVKYLFYALAMMELGIDHGINKFEWSYVKNPMLAKNYSDSLWKSAEDVLRKRHGINVSL